MEESHLAVDMGEIIHAYEKINKTLNTRFEKNLDLYITNQQSQEIKEIIAWNYWDGLYEVFKKKILSGEILTLEIIRHGWLVAKDIPQQDINEFFNPIFVSCNREVFLKAVKPVMDNKVWVNKKIKRSLTILYYKYVDIDICRRVLDGKELLSYNKVVLITCIERVLDICTKPRELFFTAEKYVEKYTSLVYEGVLKYSKTLLNKKDKTWNAELAEVIFDKKIDRLYEDDTSELWMNVFRNLGPFAVRICYEYILDRGFYEYGEYEKRLMVELIRDCIVYNINLNDRHLDYYVREWLKVFQVDSSFIKGEFVLATRYIKDQNNLIDKMLDYPMDNELKDELQDIRNSTKESNAITDFNGLLNELVYYYNLKNRTSHYRYVDEMLCGENRIPLLLALSEYMDKEIVCEFFMEIIKGNIYRDAPKICKIVINAINTNSNGDEIYKRFIDTISVRRYEYMFIKKFLQEKDFDLYKKLYRK